MKNADETKIHFMKEIEQNELMSKKHKKVYATLSYMEHFLNLASVVIGCISVSVFASPHSISTGITSSAIWFDICAIITRNIKV